MSVGKASKVPLETLRLSLWMPARLQDGASDPTTSPHHNRAPAVARRLLKCRRIAARSMRRDGYFDQEDVHPPGGTVEPFNNPGLLCICREVDGRRDRPDRVTSSGARARFTVRRLRKVPGGTPTDSNSDRTHDDVNGNGRIDFADVVWLFTNLSAQFFSAFTFTPRSSPLIFFRRQGSASRPP